MKYIEAKRIVLPVNHNASKHWFGIDYNMNIYRGCCHGCIYCDSRSDCYQVKDFHEVAAKENALSIIQGDLKGKRKRGVIGTGAMSDPYNPFEEESQLTRGALKQINAYGFGVNIVTKSPLVTRDMDILKDIRTHSPVCVGITITSIHDSLSQQIEPFVAPSSERFEAVEQLSHNNIYTGILMMPILPFISDSEENIRGIVQRAWECGADFIYPAMGMTVRSGQREFFYSCLDKLFPGMKEKYMTAFGSSYQCISPNHKRLWKVFSEECKEKNIHYKMADIIRTSRERVQQKQICFF